MRTARGGAPSSAATTMDQLFRDVRYAVRTLVRAPLFTVTVVVTLALGIGANTAIFTVVDAVLLESLPYDAPHQLVTAWLNTSRRGGATREWFDYPDFRDYRAEPGLFQAMAAWSDWNPTLASPGEAEAIQGAVVSHGMFDGVFRVHALLGRSFTAADDAPGAPGVVLLSFGAWKRRYGGDPTVIGRTLSLDDQPYTVVGVLPEGFRPPFVADAELWSPLRFDDTRCGRGCYTLRTVARLAPGVTLSQARARASAVAARLAAAYPEADGKVGATLVPLRDDVVGDSARALWILLGAVGFVLLIACVNVANLLLVRGVGRECEMTVRAALGARRGAIVRQLLTESVVLAAAGGAAGLALASFGTDTLLSLAPAGSVPRIDTVTVDGRILAFTAALTLLTGVLMGLAPAWRVARGDLHPGLRGRRRRSGLRSLTPGLHGGSVVAQVALALILSVGAGLLVKSFQRLSSQELGFTTRGVLTMRLALPPDLYRGPTERVAFYGSLLQRVQALKGVIDVGATGALPLAGDNQDVDLRVEGQPPPDPTLNQGVWVRPVAGDYFETVKLGILLGRSFRASDDAAATRVALVNQALIERYFDGVPPLGRRIALGGGDRPSWRTIVGVVRDTRHFGLREPARPAVYVPYGQMPIAAMSVVMRVEGDPATAAPGVRAALAELDPRLAASRLRPLDDLVQRALAPDRFVATLLGGFAALALALAAVGLYGVVSFGVSQRLHEIGIRLALGAEATDVHGMVVRRGLVLAGAGIVVGVAGALALTRVLHSLLYDVAPDDPGTFVLTCLVLTAVAVLASWLPARRAGRADPVTVLRRE